MEIIFDNLDFKVQAQYQNTNIEMLVKGIQNIYNKYVVKMFESLINHNFSITTAKSAGLDCWGWLLHFNRHIPISGGAADRNFFSFYKTNFIDLQFYYLDKNNFFTIEDYYYRRFLVLIYQGQFIINNLPFLNNFMSEIFEDLANVTVRDSYDMQYVVYVFNTTETQILPKWFTYVLDNYDLLIRPAGVGVNYLETNYKYFGFKTNSEIQAKTIRGNFFKTIFKKDI